MQEINEIVDKLKILAPGLGGALRFFGDCFGRPGDNYHKVVDAEFEDNYLLIKFDCGERLMVWNPYKFTTRKGWGTFKIGGALRVCWEWFYYGRAHLPENLYYIDYVVENQEIKVTTNIDWYIPDFKPSTKKPAVELC